MTRNGARMDTSSDVEGPSLLPHLHEAERDGYGPRAFPICVSLTCSGPLSNLLKGPEDCSEVRRHAKRGFALEYEYIPAAGACFGRRCPEICCGANAGRYRHHIRRPSAIGVHIQRPLLKR